MSTKTTVEVSCDVCKNEITDENKATHPKLEPIVASSEWSPYFCYKDICRACNARLVLCIRNTVTELRDTKEVLRKMTDNELARLRAAIEALKNLEGVVLNSATHPHIRATVMVLESELEDLEDGEDG